MTMQHDRLQLDDPIAQCVSRLSQIYGLTYTLTTTKEWSYFTPPASSTSTHGPSQGWKIHLSALPIHAVPMLETISELLALYAIPWKVCSSLQQLIRLSSPPLPVAQTGKFVTIYPSNADQALEIAALLHEKTARFEGALIPSDCQYAPDSCVFYRYGAFQPVYFYDLTSALRKPALCTPTGEQVEDKRSVGRQHYPSWVVNPFPAHHKATQYAHAENQGLFGKNLTVRGVLRQSIKGGIYTVTRGPESFILKEARFGTCPDILRRDARDRLTNEFRILRKLESLNIAPKPIELFDADHNRYLLMEHLAGRNLRAHIEKANYLGGYDPQHLRELCHAIISLVQICHSAGIILRDLTPNNILVTPDGCKLIDFELAHILDSQEVPFYGSTPGYIPHTIQPSAKRDTPDYDFYALGAVLFFILTGCDPYLGPSTDIVSRVPGLLHLFLPHTDLLDLAKQTKVYLSWTQQTTPATTCAPEQLLPITPGSDTPSIKPRLNPLTRDHLQRNVLAVADHLYETADWQNTTYLWKDDQHKQFLHPACFQSGTAGIAYFLTEVARATQKKKYSAYARRLLEWTTSTHPFDPSCTPAGLYFGYAAIPWVQSIVALSTGDDSYLHTALALANQIATAPILHQDITHGAAGIGLMHLALYRSTGNIEQFQHALRLSHHLAATAEEDQAGNILWSVNTTRMWGFAHGTAGIAFFLLTMYEQTGNPQLKDLVEKAAHALCRAAVETRDPRGWTWSQGPSDQSTLWTHWCNGASGIGRFLLAASRVFHNPTFEHAALAAGYAVCTGRNAGSLCQCHGLAGDGEFLLLLGRSLARSDMHGAALHMAEKLWALQLPLEQNSVRVWRTEHEHAPAYMTGYCGVYSFLLRLLYKNVDFPFFTM